MSDTTHYPNFAYLAGYHEQTLTLLVNNLVDRGFVPKEKLQELEVYLTAKIKDGRDAEKRYSSQ
jgi:hypothetical protein